MKQADFFRVTFDPFGSKGFFFEATVKIGKSLKPKNDSTKLSLSKSLAHSV